jgi:hypothetical protein
MPVTGCARAATGMASGAIKIVAAKSEVLNFISASPRKK